VSHKGSEQNNILVYIPTVMVKNIYFIDLVQVTKPVREIGMPLSQLPVFSHGIVKQIDKPTFCAKTFIL
jgi:hypothetical protein